jgi:hypothetical protein
MEKEERRGLIRNDPAVYELHIWYREAGLAGRMSHLIFTTPMRSVRVAVLY